ncbi:MAG TPA: hypothetical protein VMV92_17710 [Streptosporangiaceae bacterium]|nr:hypothetical protein [Streptosporangiaceae bacterium]
MLNTSPQVRQEIIRMGGHSGLVDAYIAAMIGIMGVAAAAYGWLPSSGCAVRKASNGQSLSWPRRPGGSAGRVAICSSAAT